MSIFNESEDEVYLEHNSQRQELGYKLIKEDSVKCGNCNKDLLDVVKVKENERKNYYIVQCPYCGDKSFKYLLTGIVHCMPHEGLIIGRVITEIPLENTFINNIEVRKNGS